MWPFHFIHSSSICFPFITALCHSLTDAPLYHSLHCCNAVIIYSFDLVVKITLALLFVITYPTLVLPEVILGSSLHS